MSSSEPRQMARGSSVEGTRFGIQGSRVVRAHFLQPPQQLLPAMARRNSYNAGSFFAVASAVDWPDFEALFMPFDLGTFICDALRLPPVLGGRRPPELPLTPASRS